MIKLENIEAPLPLLAPGKYLESEQKPLYYISLFHSTRWVMKKLSLARWNSGKRINASTKQSKKAENLPSIFEEGKITEKIPIKYVNHIADKRYTQYVIYESYKPKNLREMQYFMHFMIRFRTNLPNKMANFREDPNYQAIEVEDILSNPSVSKEIKNYYNSEVETKLPKQFDQEKILIFDSNFECGNLDRVTLVSLNEYNLFLNVDTNTQGHSQWFYFAVTNTEENQTVTFNILNCTNSQNLFKSGMKPLVFSELGFEKNNLGWEADTNVKDYCKNTILKNPVKDMDTKNTYYTLSFSYKFKYSSDRVYFAYSFPYSVSMIQSKIQKIKKELLKTAKRKTILDKEALQDRIKEFMQNKPEVSTETEDQYKMKKEKLRTLTKNRSESTLIPEMKIVNNQLRQEYSKAEKLMQFDWQFSEDFEIETENLIYRQETLCHSLSGYPVNLITITAVK